MLIRHRNHRLRIFERDLPVQVISPTIGRAIETDRQPHDRSPCGAPGLANDSHTSLGGSSAALPPIAADARGDNVLPVLAATLRYRHDVIERQLRHGKTIPAVLTLVVVACIDVGAREGDIVEVAPNRDVAEQPNDGWKLEAHGNGPDLTIVDRNHLDLTLTPQGDRLAPIYDIERLVGRVQQKGLLHLSTLFLPDTKTAVKPSYLVTYC